MLKFFMEVILSNYSIIMFKPVYDATFHLKGMFLLLLLFSGDKIPVVVNARIFFPIFFLGG